MLDISEARKVYDYWGDRMPLLACEEMAELIQAISKYERAVFNENRPKQEVIDEMRDVIISIAALGERYDISEKELQKAINKKLDRCY